MARSFFNRFFGASTDRRKHGLRPQRSPSGGLSNPTEKLFSRKDPWQVEWNRRRQEVSDRYMRDKRRLRKQELSARRRLKDQLRREQRRVEQEYRLHELDKEDPRYDRAVRKAEKKFDLRKGQLERKHDNVWDDALHDLKIDRERDKRSVTDDMKKEYRLNRSSADETLYTEAA